jgi:hypothetical protein
MNGYSSRSNGSSLIINGAVSSSLYISRLDLWLGLEVWYSADTDFHPLWSMRNGKAGKKGSKEEQPARKMMS